MKTSKGIPVCCPLQGHVTGNSYRDLFKVFEVAPNIVYYIIKETLLATNEKYGAPAIKQINTPDQWKKSHTNLLQQKELSPYFGCTQWEPGQDQVSLFTGSHSYNYKTFHLIILVVPLSADYKLYDVILALMRHALMRGFLVTIG